MQLKEVRWMQGGGRKYVNNKSLDITDKQMTAWNLLSLCDYFENIFSLPSAPMYSDSYGAWS